MARAASQPLVAALEGSQVLAFGLGQAARGPAEPVRSPRERCARPDGAGQSSSARQPSLGGLVILIRTEPVVVGPARGTTRPGHGVLTRTARD